MRALGRGSTPLRLLDPLLGRLGLRLDLGQTALGGGDRALSRIALALQLLGLLAPQPLQLFDAGLALLLQICFERPDLGGGSLFGCCGGLRCLAQPTLGRLDLLAEVSVAGVALLLAHLPAQSIT